MMYPRQPYRSRRPAEGVSQVAEELELLESLAQAGVNPSAYVSAKAIQASGFELAARQIDHLKRLALLHEARRKHFQPAAVPPERAFRLGDIVLDLDVLPSGLLITGAIGSGKTVAEWGVVDQLRRHGELALRFWDYKGESRRVMDFWPDSRVFSPQTAPWQWIEPPLHGDPMTYFSGVMEELRTEAEIRPETFPLAYGIFERIVRGLAPGDAYPSLSDLRRVVEHEAKAQSRENLFTLARVLSSVETVLGVNARVRHAAPYDGRGFLTAYDFVGVDPRFFRLLLGLHFNKLLQGAHAQEHDTSLRAVEVIDEAAPLASIELNVRGVANLSCLKRFAILCRFTGTALIIGIQNLSQLDPFLKNAGTLVVLRCPTFEDALDASRLLGLPPGRADELLRLQVGEAYVRSVGWPSPIKTRFPDFP